MSILSASLYHTNPSGGFYTFAGFPDCKIYKAETGSQWNQHLLFGDYITVLDLEIKNNRVKVKSRNKVGWVKIDSIQPERVLEVNFIDIGQGDGCHIVTPDDQHILVDAGKGDNMNRYLVWRFYLYKKTKPIDIDFKAIISHSDADHYGGFSTIFKNPALRFTKVYHNGIVERPGQSHLFGNVTNGYITTLIEDTTGILDLVNDPANLKGTGSNYLKTLSQATKNNPQVEFRMLSIEDHYVPTFDANNQINNKPFFMKLLGPITETVGGKKALKSINDTGKDKNGHSVIFRLEYGNLKVLLGGDLNEEYGKIIMDFYKAANATKELEVDVAKACHHGSTHFDYDFLKSLNPLATVISSGDDEPFCHPRPDTLGAIGKCSYGNKPLIYSTELARSNKDLSRNNMKAIEKYFTENALLLAQIKAIKSDPSQAEEFKKLKDKLTNKEKEINSFLTRYGMINLRSDGNKMIIAQKLERDAAYGKWDIQKMQFDSQTSRFEKL